MAGSFACHGANILRSVGTGRPLWITDFTDIHSLRSGMRVTIDGDFVHLSPDAAGAFRYDRGQEWRKSSSHEFQEWDVTSRPAVVTAYCYWHHRRYDRLTASLMVPGLTRSARSLGYQEAVVDHRLDGRLWFRAAPSTADLERLAADTTRAPALLRHQVQVYDEILRSLSGPANTGHRRLAELCELLHAYFSVHLLTHNTYEHVLLELREHLRRGAPRTADLADLLDVVLTPDIVAWHRARQLDNHKDLLTDSTPVDLPDTTVTVAVERHVRRVYREYISLGDALPPLDDDRLKLCATTIVVKEWKFVLNKLIFSRFGAQAHELAERRSLDLAELRTMDHAELVALAGPAEFRP
ncbi:hypothetical protein ACFWN2_04605 [Lentzea sp. NPDC058436]|uniref:hypothetical protein n=1 Tax=Lentzea sp. NPDC058436 TaxID=3346499 RepID=UPI003664D08D